MGGPLPGEYAFEIDSNVGRYWLAHGEGFDVVVERGPRLGVVKDVVVNPVTNEVSSVVVRRPVHRAAEVPVDDMTVVLPASRRFLVTAAVPVFSQPSRRERLRARALHVRLGWWAFRDRLAAVTRRRRRGVQARWPAFRSAVAAAARWTLAAAVIGARAVGRAVVMVTAAIGRVVFAVVVAVVLGSTWAVRHARVRLRESKQSARSRVRRMR